MNRYYNRLYVLLESSAGQGLGSYGEIGELNREETTEAREASLEQMTHQLNLNRSNGTPCRVTVED